MDKIILCFELNNNQRDFALLMQMIQAIETDINKLDYEHIRKELTICYYWLKEENSHGYANRDIVRNIEQSWNSAETKRKNGWIAHPISELERVVQQKERYDISYYVRVKNDSKEDIQNIQYLLLILQQFPSVIRRIKVFLEPFEGYNSEKNGEKKSDVYFQASHYLRFLLKTYKYIFYSAYYEKSGNVNITQLTGKKMGIQSTFFPLIEVDSKMHAVLARYFSLDAQGNWEEGEVQDEFKDILEIARRILEIRIEDELGDRNERKSCRELLYQVLAEERLTSLEYAVFSVLIPISEKLTRSDIWVYRERARSIGSGLIQIIENIVSHSANHKGIFTFRILKNGTRYLGGILKEPWDNQVGGLLIIDIADANIHETILDNFKNKLEDKDKDLKESQLAVSHFFGKFDDRESKAKKAWEKYRKNNPVKCLGLTRLGIELQLIRAILQMRSDTSYDKENNLLSYSENNYNALEFQERENHIFIPGTQFLLTIPIRRREPEKQHNANILLNEMAGLREGDKSYAGFIDLDFEAFIDLERYDREFYACCQKETLENAKDYMVELWKNRLNEWETNTNSGKVYYFDLYGGAALQSPWGAETFCKGLMESAVLGSDRMRYVAFINCSNTFLPLLVNTMVLAQRYPGEINQFYLHGQDGLRDIVLTGSDYKSVIWNAIQYCYAKGQPPLFLQNYYRLVGNESIENSPAVDLLPFDVILEDTERGVTLFEDYIEKVAQKPLTATDEAGYLITRAHMRLGNKVHLNDFYEVSILFRKPRIARKLALLIVRRMRKDNINLNDNWLFYGYASYSRTILTSLTEIVKNYQDENGYGGKYSIEFVVYQNDIMVQKTLTHISPKVRMYYSGAVPVDQKINIIQIVPISSTLTTFRKMLDMLLSDRRKCKEQFQIVRNYSLFWVKDFHKEGYKNEPTEIEREYWDEIREKRSISTQLISPEPQYFCYRETKWYNPLNCEQCYPENVLDEIALVETDVTSTVPSQQLEVRKESALEWKDNRESIENEIRLINLKDCVYYGHVSRDVNHFQYYIDTIKYFHCQKEFIADWLKVLYRGKEKTADNKVLNIIVTPQHPTNVEFGHYVNEYYFDGIADMVMIDSSKEYRSNIIAKYADIKAAIETAYSLHISVKFIYVDDTIITGGTYRRVNNLLHSLVPRQIRRTIQFSQVFVLLNRLSFYSRMDYVENVERDFHAFVNLDISSIRNFGDSCTMCTLQKNSVLFFKRSATAEISRYWDKKKRDYRAIPFDKYAQERAAEGLNEKGYFRMLCSHYAKSRMRADENLKEDIERIISLFVELKKVSDMQIDDDIVLNPQSHIEYFESGDFSPIYCCVFKKDVTAATEAFLKVLCRPFFSYGKNYRQAVLDLFLVLAESFLNPEFDDKLKNSRERISENKEYLNDYKLREALWNLCIFLKDLFPVEKRISFVQKYLMEGLTDLRSNYIIRLTTMQHFKKQVAGFISKVREYREYERMIHRLINSSADETKSLWLEYLLVSGKENKSNMTDMEELSARRVDSDQNFNSFLDSLLIENTRLYYDSMLNFVEKASDYRECTEEESIRMAVDSMWGDYYIRNLRRFVQLEIMVDYPRMNLEEMIKERIIETAKLLFYLKNEKTHGIKRYNLMKKNIEDLLYEGDQLQILTSPFEGAKDGDELYPVTDYDKGKVDRKVIRRIKEAMDSEALKNKSYFIGNNYIILCIDNNEKYLNCKQVLDKALTRIQQLYFYIECSTQDHFRVILRVRKILMYRYQILHWIEADFNNNAMPVLAEQMGIKRQLMRDRAGDHNSSMEILTTEKLLQSEYKEDDQDIYRWILLKAYVNMRIARLFRCEWGDYEAIRDKAYTLKQNEDSVNKALVTLGEAFFGDTLKDYSPKRYFELVIDCFQFDVDIDGLHMENITLEELQKVTENLYARCENEYYYKQEYIISIIFDIFFNAMKVCRNWEVDLDRFFRIEGNKEFVGRRSITENDDVAQYYILKSEVDKCRIGISTESIPGKETVYLVFRNIVAVKTKEMIETDNEKLKTEIETKDTAGISIQAMKWYTEAIGGHIDVSAVFQYEWDENKKVVEFVTKLPILRGEAQSDEDLLY